MHLSLHVRNVYRVGNHYVVNTRNKPGSLINAMHSQCHCVPSAWAWVFALRLLTPIVFKKLC